METLLTEHVREQREMNQRLAEIVALLDISSSS